MSTRSSIHFQNKSLSELSTFRLGGMAERYIYVTDVGMLKEIVCSFRNEPYIVVGKGSNTIFSDGNYKGIVIHMGIDYCEMHDAEIEVGAGFSFSLLGARTARKGLSGLEFASGIPGTVGGAIFMNAGANSMETKDALTWVDFMDLDGEIHRYGKEDLSFGYRSSSFQSMKGIIIGAHFSLTLSDTAKEKQRQIIDYRMKTQPYKAATVGCMFENPEGHSAGALIEQCGLKGLSEGDIEVSMVHGNFFVNKGRGTQANVRALAQKVQEEVRQKTGIELTLEARFLD